MNFFTADWHFFHRNIIKYCTRPFSSEKQMRNKIIENYNNTVKKEDTCFVLGDVAMLGSSQWERLKATVSKLNGTKHLIVGNHDELRWQRYVDVGFTSVHSALWMKEEGLNIVMAHDPSIYCTIPPNSVFLCGHVHILFKSLLDQRTINVGVDVWNFYPINMKQIRTELKI